VADVIVCALYRFVRLDDFADLRQPLLKTLERNGLRGTLLLAREGINGTVAGPRAGIDALLNHLERDARFAGIDIKESLSDRQPFMRTKVKLKKEIVTMGQPDIDPLADAGAYVEPAQWNALISDPEVTLIDTRNDYEVYHLKGGILKYLEEVPETDTRWQGECFVFDERVTALCRTRTPARACARARRSPPR